MPERTADALVKAGRVKVELQPIFLRARATNPQGFFVVLAEPAAV